VCILIEIPVSYESNGECYIIITVTRSEQSRAAAATAVAVV